jgi:hypothetical protein
MVLLIYVNLYPCRGAACQDHIKMSFTTSLSEKDCGESRIFTYISGQSRIYYKFYYYHRCRMGSRGK